MARISEDRSAMLRNLAEIMIKQSDPNKWEKAWHFLQRAWALRPSDPATFIIRERLAKKLGRSKRLADPYQLIREQLETGDPIVVRIHRIERNRGFEVFYYGVPGWLPWIDGAEEYKVGDHISNVLFRSIDEEGKIYLEWPKLREGQLIKCRVRKIKPYGILVDYQGIQGLVHRSKMSNLENFDPDDLPIGKNESIYCRVISFRPDGTLELGWEATEEL